MKVSLQKVTPTERQILWNLLQYMIFETSPYGNNEINPDGAFSYKYFDKYFTDDDRIAFLIRDESNNLLGFTMINQYLQKTEPGHAIAEFMILPRFRRQGIGQEVAKQCFSLFPGNWEVQPAPGSEAAYKFWKNVIDEVTEKDNQMVDGIFVFQVNVANGNRWSLFEGIRSYGENERDDPATAGVGDAPRKKRNDDYLLENCHE